MGSSGTAAEMEGPGMLLALVREFRGLPDKQKDFLICQFSALCAAVLFRRYLHPVHTSPAIRHAVATLLGLYICMFCFGWYTALLVGDVLLCYGILLTADRKHVHIYSLAVAMCCLVAVQVMYYVDDDKESSEITGAIMIITQKITKVAFELHDGTAKKAESLNPGQKLRAIRRLPGPLEYLSYHFNFLGIVAGPLCSFKDYVSFIEGRCYSSKEKSSPGSLEPSPTSAVMDKLGRCCLLLGLHLTLSKAFPVTYNLDESFLAAAHLPQRLGYMYLSMFACRPKYYFLWTMADAINNAAGFGFSGYDKDGKPCWDLLTNLNILKIETSTSLKMLIDNWNIHTSAWLKEICYERCPVHPMLATFLLSALWHGVFPGYYLAFLSSLIMSLAGQAVRRNLRHHFTHSLVHKRFYDVLTWMATQVSNSYSLAPFILLSLEPSLRFYRSWWYIFHILALLLILLLPQKRVSFPNGNSKAGSVSQGNNGTLHQNGAKAADNNNDPQATTVH
ncbi:membrane-bound glycerophospholipid O-acyltransferase 2-like [Lissotriton helveticus]